MTRPPALTRDSRYNYSIMALQGRGYMSVQDREFLIEAIKSYEAELED